MRHTPLHDEHEPLGGKLVEFGGWHMPVQYGPILEEVRCVRERVGLFDLSHMGRFNLTGPDAVAFVDRVATCYCARIPLGAISLSTGARTRSSWSSTRATPMRTVSGFSPTLMGLRSPLKTRLRTWP